MMIERGPHGQIQVYELKDHDELILHALDVLQNQLCSLFPKVYMREQLNKKQLCIDCTGLIPLSSFTPSEMQWNAAHARNECKNILLQLIDALDYCLPLSCCNASIETVWVNTETGEISFPFLPIVSCDQIYDCRLSSLNLDDFEQLLLFPLFSNYIEENTRHCIINALQNDDETALRQIAHNLTENEAVQEKMDTNSRFSLISLVLLLACSLFLSIPIFFNTMDKTINHSVLSSNAILFIFILILFLSVLLHENKRILPQNINDKSSESGAHLLFSTFNTSLSYAHNKFEKMIFPAFLTEQSEYGADPQIHTLKRAIWTNDFLIGSNKYSCDLYLNDPSINEMHARIIRRENHFFLIDLASIEGTWISHRKLFSHEETLLNHNDLIRIGHRYFLFSFQHHNQNHLDHHLESAGTSNEGVTSPPVRR